MQNRKRRDKKGSSSLEDIIASKTLIPKVRISAAKKFIEIAYDLEIAPGYSGPPHFYYEHVYDTLTNIMTDNTFPKELKLLAENKFADIAKKFITNGYHYDLEMLVKRANFLSKDLLVTLIEKLSKRGHFNGLIELTKNEGLSQDIRLEAKSKIIDAVKRQIEDCISWSSNRTDCYSLGITSLIKIGEDKGLDKDLRKLAWGRLWDAVKNALEKGSYFDILMISKDETLYKDMRELAKKNLVKAAERTIKDAKSSEELFILAKAWGLPDDVRKRAKKRAKELEAEEEEFLHDPSMW